MKITKVVLIEEAKPVELEQLQQLWKNPKNNQTRGNKDGNSWV